MRAAARGAPIVASQALTMAMLAVTSPDIPPGRAQQILSAAAQAAGALMVFAAVDALVILGASSRALHDALTGTAVFAVGRAR